MNNKDLWQAILAELQLTLSKPIFSSWFIQTQITKTVPAGKDRQIVEIAVANPFAKDHIEQRYQGQVKLILDRITNTSNELVFIVNSAVFSKSKKKTEPGPLFTTDFDKEKQQEITRALTKAGLRPDFTFDNFAVSSTNEVAYAAAQAVAKNPGKAYHLLFLYGGVGVGKTHLMQAIGHGVIGQKPNIPLVYSTAEEFTNEIIQAIRTKNTQGFRQKYRQAKMLLIDDVQFIGGKNAVQEEFFHTFNTILKAGGQIILTSDKLPDKIMGLEDRLRSRFEGGLTIDIQQPNFELRTAILLIKSHQYKQPLPMDAARLIAANVESTRKLEGFLVRLVAESEAKQQPITLERVQVLLGKVASSKPESLITIKPKTILEEVANYYNLKLNQLKGPVRLKGVVFPRQVAMYLLRTELKIPLTRVGEYFGGRDHTTVMHSVEKIGKEVIISESLRLDLEALKKRLVG